MEQAKSRVDGVVQVSLEYVVLLMQMISVLGLGVIGQREFGPHRRPRLSDLSLFLAPSHYDDSPPSQLPHMP
jgi:hypothetical protein